jgi:DNA-directed RNA polymerase I, II, and III subunit RPABC2
MSDEKDYEDSYLDEGDLEGDAQIGELEDCEEDDEPEEEELIETKRETRFDIVNMEKTYENYYTQKRETKPFLTKFERAKLLGSRAEMIASGSPTLVEIPKGIKNINAYDIAKLEFKERKIPLIIRRYLPNGMAEDWRLSDMVIFE